MGSTSMMETKKFGTKDITQIGLMAALVFVGTAIRIEIPAGPDGTMLHFGNVFSILSGLLFGPVAGGLSAGIGSALSDLMGKYASEAWITFIIKFAMGFVAGVIMRFGKKENTLSNNKAHTLVAAISGSATYIVLYIIKNFLMLKYVNGMPIEGILPVLGVKLTVSTINGIIAVTASVILALALRPALKRTGILQ